MKSGGFKGGLAMSIFRRQLTDPGFDASLLFLFGVVGICMGAWLIGEDRVGWLILAIGVGNSFSGWKRLRKLDRRQGCPCGVVNTNG